MRAAVTRPGGQLTREVNAMIYLAKSGWRIAMVVTQAAAAQLAIGGEVDISGDVTLSSDYMFRGVSQTMSSPALQGSLSVEQETGLYGYLLVSNVDFTDSSDPADGGHVEFDFEFGYLHEISERAEITLAWTRYVYPGTKPGIDYDYNEWLGVLAIDDRYSLEIGYSRDVFAGGSPGISYVAGTGFDLTEQTGIEFEIGYYNLDPAYGTSYRYAEVSIFGNANFLDWRLSYFTTSDEAADLFYASTIEDRVVLALGVAF